MIHNNFYPMRLSFVYTLILLTIFFISLAHSAGTLEGTITNNSDSNPVSYAFVEAGDNTTYADGSGFYVFPGILAGTYNMTVTAQGYSTGTASGVVVSDGATTTKNFILSSGKFTIDIPEIKTTLETGQIYTAAFTITNTGDLAAGFEIEKVPLPDCSRRAAQFAANPSVDVTAPAKLMTNNPVNGKTTKSIELSLSPLTPSQIVSSEWSMAGPVNLILDDGFADYTVGTTEGGQIIWLNRFTPGTGAYPFLLTDISVIFPETVTIGDQMELVVWEDLDGDGNPGTGSTFLYSENVSVQTNNHFLWNTYALASPVLLDCPGDVLIGIVNRSGRSWYTDYPAALDWNWSQRRSWVGIYASGNPPEPPALPADSTWGLIDDLVYSGNWTLRGSGSPPEVTWLSESPITGTVSAGGTQRISVQLDTTGLNKGTYSALLNINTDTPYGVITVPITMKVTMPFTLTKEGTIGTEIVVTGSDFGTKKGKVLIGSVGTKIKNWSDSDIFATVTKVPLPVGAYDVSINLQPYKTATPIITPGGFSVKNPELDPLVIGYGQTGHVITVTGSFFSTKKGKVYLEDQITGKKKSCKVTSWSMDPATGISSLTFVVPKPKGYVPGVYTSYNLKITNKVGTASTTFRID
jgi:hypothetical protein